MPRRGADGGRWDVVDRPLQALILGRAVSWGWGLVTGLTARPGYPTYYRWRRPVKLCEFHRWKNDRTICD